MKKTIVAALIMAALVAVTGCKKTNKKTYRKHCYLMAKISKNVKKCQKITKIQGSL